MRLGQGATGAAGGVSNCWQMRRGVDHVCLSWINYARLISEWNIRKDSTKYLKNVFSKRFFHYILKNVFLYIYFFLKFFFKDFTNSKENFQKNTNWNQFWSQATNGPREWFSRQETTNDYQKSEPHMMFQWITQVLARACTATTSNGTSVPLTHTLETVSKLLPPSFQTYKPHPPRT